MSTTPEIPSNHDLVASIPDTGVSTLQGQISDLLRTPCRCPACEPMYVQRTQRPDPAFADLLVSGREAFEAAQEKNRLGLEKAAVARRHLPRVMDLPQDIDLAKLRRRLAYENFHLGCPQYREVVMLLANGSFYSEVALSRIGHFDRRQAAYSAPRKRSKKKAAEPRRVRPVCSLLTQAELVIPPEQIAADRAQRARLAQPDRVAEAREAAQQQFSEQLVAVMLGMDVPQADET